jgi:hypothetical protein
MSSNFERNRDTDARKAQIAAKTEELKRWLELNNPDVHPGIATQKAFMEDMGDAFLTATEQDFEYSLRTMTTILSRHRVQTEAEIKQELIEKICELLRNPDGGTRGGKYSDHDLSTFRKKAEFMTVPELTTRLEEIVRAQTMSPTEAHQVLVSARKYQGYPQLGKTIVRPGTIRAVPLDAAYLRGLDAWELKKFCRLYGTEQVNARLAGKE